MRIGIIGAGLTGSLLAINLLRTLRDVHVTLIDSSPDIGRGLAYSTDNPDHLLNVRASNMSAFVDDPSHFLRWLWARDSRELNPTPVPPSGKMFVSRKIYGDYIEAQLKEAIASRVPSSEFTIVAESVVDLHEGERRALTLSDGRTLSFDKVALCLGNFPPGPPSGLTHAAAASLRYIANPWDAARLSAIPETENVLILGSGLTMVDVVQSLQSQGHRGRITVVSRRGLVPLPHRAVRPGKVVFPTEAPTGKLSRLLQWLRSVVRANAPLDWRLVMDALRPQTSRLWQALPHLEKRRFLRHARAYWDIHRHRLATAVADVLGDLRGSGRLVVNAARVESIDVGASGFSVRAASRGAAAQTKSFPWIVNCTGPQCDYEHLSNPLIRHLLDRGIIRPDALRMGLDVSTDSRVIDRDGAASAHIYALGPPAKGVFLESAAVPDIRAFCAALAQTFSELPSTHRG